MKISVLTMFNGLSTTYSLVNVVADQLKMMLDNNIDVNLIVTENCSDNEKFGIFLDKRINWVKISNKLNGKIINWRDYSNPTGKLHDTFTEEVQFYKSEFEKHIYDSDVCIMHDILYQGWHLVHNVAIRQAQKNLPNTKFISFTHSLPVNRPTNMEYPFSLRFTGMEKTLFAYPTHSGIKGLSKQYDVPEGNCRVVYNTIPLIDSMSDDVKKIHKEFNLCDSEILIVYGGRLTTGKKFEKVAMLAKGIKDSTGKKVKIVFCDFPSADIAPKSYKAKIKSCGLEAHNILFTSDIGYINGFPRSGLLELFTLSNLFICPSFSESFGLTVLEAGSRGNFIVLNECVPALMELGKNLKAYFMRWDARNFGFDTVENYFPSEEEYYREHGERIVSDMMNDKAIYAKTMIRNEYSYDWIWKHQLEPLLKKL